MHFLIVINPAAGKSDHQHKENAISSFLESKGALFETYYTRKENSISHLYNFLLEKQEITDIVIIGGDGTINLCLNALPHFNYTLSVVNNGTGNDSVKNLYHSKSLGEQVRATMEGEIKTIDLGSCNDRIFMNGVGIGFDGLVVRKMASLKKKRRGLWAYLSIVLQLLPKKTSFATTILLDGKAINQSIFSMTITKGTTFGGGFLMNPNALPEDGLLDICRFNKLNLPEKLMILPWVFIGKHGWFKPISYLKSKEIEIISDTPLPAHIDGEIIESHRFVFKVLPKRLKIRV